MIRPATDADIPAIADLHISSWRDTYRGMLPDSYVDGAMADDLRAKWERRRFGEDLWGWLAEADGVAGFAVCAGSDDPVLLDNLHVDPNRRGGGWGAKLLHAARRGMADLGRPHLYLTVLESNSRALSFYQREGGTISGTVDDQIFDLPVRAVRLEWGPPDGRV